MLISIVDRITDSILVLKVHFLYILSGPILVFRSLPSADDLCRSDPRPDCDSRFSFPIVTGLLLRSNASASSGCPRCSLHSPLTFVGLRSVAQQNFLIASNGTENLVLPIKGEFSGQICLQAIGIECTDTRPTIQSHARRIRRRSKHLSIPET
jgi:hypothetical protein